MEPKEPSSLPPAAARAMIRAGARPGTTSGWCTGYVQANLLAVPRDIAFDVLLFAWRNPAACPMIDVTDPGDPCPRSAAPDADLRTDLPGYVSYRDGVAVAELHDATPLWRGDLVALLTGCSFTAEAALLAAGLPMRHLDQGKNVSMYFTDRQCRSAGRISGPLVVSMRYLPAEAVATAADVTGALPLAHGGPIHSGEPHELGIADLDKPDFGDPVSPEAGDVPVFWACGVTLQAAIMASRPAYAIGHSPGKMFITDLQGTPSLSA